MSATPAHTDRDISEWYMYIVTVLLLIVGSKYYRNNKEYKAQLANAAAENAQHELEIKKLQEAGKFQKKLISIIAHDVRNPISSIVSLFNFYSESEMKVEDFQFAKKELNCKMHSLDVLLENMLLWSGRGEQKPSGSKDIIVLHDLVEANKNLYGNTTKNISIHNHIPKGAKIYASVNEINVVIRNLLSNAIKFTKKNGRIDFLIEKENKKLHLIIQDSGIGMTWTQLQNLFANKEIRPTNGTDGEKGNGFGLILTRDFVESNGGSISVKSDTNTGTRFVLEFPLVNY